MPLKRSLPEVDFWGVGGDDLEKRGLRLLYHLKDFSSWGITEVLSRIPFYYRALKAIEKKAVETGTKTAILVDFQEFNLKLAGRLKTRGIDVLYFVAPQAWAWRSYRARSLRKSVHTLFTILPFEKKWFQERGVRRVVSVPHPVYHRFRDIIPKRIKPMIAPPCHILLLPGSRNFEVDLLLPEFIKVVEKLKGQGYSLKMTLVCSRNVNQHLYALYKDRVDGMSTDEELGTLLANADYALAASGTVTLSCALFGVPTVVSYRPSLLTEFIISSFGYKGFISLANIIHGREVFPEFIQGRATSYNMAQSLKEWMDNPREDTRLRTSLLETGNLIGGESENLIDSMIPLIEKNLETL